MVGDLAAVPPSAPAAGPGALPFRPPAGGADPAGSVPRTAAGVATTDVADADAVAHRASRARDDVVADDVGTEDAARFKARLRDPALRVTTYRDEASGRLVLEVRDQASGALVEQYPHERLLRLSAALREGGGGGAARGQHHDHHRAGLIDERV